MAPNKRNYTYINYNDTTHTYYSSKKRPNNQSTEDVLKKIVTRLKMILAEQGIRPTPIQEIFLREAAKGGKIQLQKNGINIAHNISISFMIDGIIYLLNHSEAININNGDEFAEAILSTDDETGRSKFHDMLVALRDRKNNVDDILKYINQFIIDVNRASRNLMPGNESPNKSIGDSRDPHIVNSKDKFFETKRSKEIAKKSNNFFIEKNEPKQKYNDEGKKLYQSSSIHKNFADSWCQIESSEDESPVKFNDTLNLLMYRMNLSTKSSSSTKNDGYETDYENDSSSYLSSNSSDNESNETNSDWNSNYSSSYSSNSDSESSSNESGNLCSNSNTSESDYEENYQYGPFNEEYDTEYNAELNDLTNVICYLYSHNGHNPNSSSDALSTTEEVSGEESEERNTPRARRYA